MIVEPPGCSAQSKSAADGVLHPLLRDGTELIRSRKAPGTLADARLGTRGVRTTFQPSGDKLKSLGLG